jgi:hypothetical protein
MHVKRRLPLFFLLDSVCQVSKNKQQKEYRDLVAKHLMEIVMLIVPEEDGEARGKAYPIVQKVIAFCNNLHDDQHHQKK